MAKVPLKTAALSALLLLVALPAQAHVCAGATS